LLLTLIATNAPVSSSRPTSNRHTQVLSPYLSARLDSLSGLELPQLVRAASEQVLRASQLEGQLLEQLFGTAATAAWPLKHQQQQLGYGGSQGAAAGARQLGSTA
jgi:hypothetical protein